MLWIEYRGSAIQCTLTIDKWLHEARQPIAIKNKTMNISDKTSRPTLGQKLSPILAEIEEAIWEKEANAPEPLLFTEKGRRAGVKIFSSVLIDMLWEYQEKNNIPQEKRVEQAEDAGTGIFLLIKQYAGIDTKKMYEKS